MPNPAKLITVVLTTIIALGFMVGAGVIALDAFTEAASSNKAELAINNSTSGVSKFAEQLPTVGTLLGIALLLMIVTVAFAYFRGWL